MKRMESVKSFLTSKNSPLVWCLLFAIFILATWFRSKCPGIPISDPDTWGYLNPALRDLAGHGLQQTHGRGIAYPLFIKWILETTGSFFAIPTIQHILGVFSGVVWWAIWREWLKWLPAGWRNALAIQFVGLLFLALYLWNSNAIVSEEMIRPEGIFPLLSLVQTFLCIVYARLRWKENSTIGSSLAGGLAILVGVICISAKPSWGFAGAVPIGLTLLGVITPFRLTCLPLQVLPLAFGIAMIFVWLSLVPKWTGWIKDNSSRTFLPSTLVTIHAPIVSRYLNAEMQKGKLSETEIAFLQNWDRRLEESKNLPKTSYSILDHDPDYLMYHSDALASIPNVNSAEEKRSFLMQLYIKSALNYPHLIFVKVVKQLPAAFGDLSKTLYRRSWNLNNKFDRSIKSMDFYKLPEVETTLQTSYQKVRSKTLDYIALGKRDLNFGPSTNKFLFRGAGPVFLSLMMLAWPAALAFSLLAKSHHKNSDLQHALKIFGIFWTTCVGTVLSVAMVHSFDIDRYLYLLSAQHSLILAAGVSLFFPWLYESLQIQFTTKTQSNA